MEKRMHILMEYVSLLKEKRELIETNISEQEENKNIRAVSFNSMDVKYGTLFICKGIHFSPDYLKGAIRAGACAYISEEKYDISDLEETVPYILVKDIRKAMAYVSDYFYNHVWKELYIAGITGTKGKSTTAYFMKYILDDFMKMQRKPRTAIISGIDNYDGVINEESHLTTPEALELHKHFHNAARSDIEYVSMEVSSQALKYNRVLGIVFDVGCFLNIGEDHISDIEHHDFEDYLSSKLLLFKQCNVACVNIETQHKDRVLAAAKADCPRVVTFGYTPDADIYGYDIVMGNKDITFRVKCDSFDSEFKISMHGLFNVENALAAIAMCYALNIPLANVKNGLKKAQVSGRMEIYTSHTKDLNVIVDYAHNKMSFESLFTSMQKEFPGKKISIVFGCPGKKALGRRRELGEIAGKYSNRVFITEEDAGEEPVMKICEEIAKHVTKQDCACSIIVDREQAIKEAIETADEDTIVLITGKGRETRQKRGTKYIDTRSDVEYVKEFLEK